MLDEINEQSALAEAGRMIEEQQFAFAALGRMLEEQSGLSTLGRMLADRRLAQRWRTSDRLLEIGDAVLALNRQGIPLRSNSSCDGALAMVAKAMNCSEGTAQRGYQYRIRFSTE